MRIMKIRKILLLSAFAALFAACENIDENERFIGPKPFTPNKNVLIEDFTGQRCINCPLASEAVHAMQTVYGAEHVIAVAIHGGPMSINAPAGLATPVGNEYNNHWAVENWPMGLVDRTGELQEYTSWSAIASQRMQQMPKVAIGMEGNSYDAESRTLQVNVAVTGNEAANGKLQVWLVENNIEAYQSMPDGSHNTKYVHQHVFRDAVNGTWGEDISVNEGETQNKTYTYELTNEKWVPANMAVVAFVYNDAEGVLQVIDAPVVK